MSEQIIPYETHKTPINGDIAQFSNPLDLSPAKFKAGLERRDENRSILIDWIRASLVEDVDFGRIVIKGRKSKPSLFKPGAEKILGKLGLTPTFPTLSEYEKSAYSGVEIDNIILRCEVLDSHTMTVGQGVGCRKVSQEKGDINKAMKMAKKSAMIDATLTCVGLSEVFTQDIEDMNFGQPGPSNDDPEFSRDHILPFGKHKGTKVRELPDDYLNWAMNNADGWLKDFAVKEIALRAGEPIPVEEKPPVDDLDAMKHEFQAKSDPKAIDDYSEEEILDFISHLAIKMGSDRFNSFVAEKIGSSPLVAQNKATLIKLYRDLKNSL